MAAAVVRVSSLLLTCSLRSMCTESWPLSSQGSPLAAHAGVLKSAWSSGGAFIQFRRVLAFAVWMAGHAAAALMHASNSFQALPSLCKLLTTQSHLPMPQPGILPSLCSGTPEDSSRADTLLAGIAGPAPRGSTRIPVRARVIDCSSTHSCPLASALALLQSMLPCSLSARHPR